MEKLIAPFGEIKILIDNRPISYFAQERRKVDDLCPHVLGRYHINVSSSSDGTEHDIACIFEPSCRYERTWESGERLECQSFYNDQRYKMSIGLECEIGYIDGVRYSDEYDYDAEYLENGMSYHIEKNTRTKEYVFGIAWIDNVGWNDPNDNSFRGAETWHGADPTVFL